MKITTIFYAALVAAMASGLQMSAFEREAAQYRLQGTKSQQQKFVTVHNYTQFPIQAAIVYTTKQGKIKPGSSIEGDQGKTIGIGASERLALPVGLEGFDRDLIINQIDPAANESAELDAFQSFIRGETAFPRDARYTVKRNIGSLIREVYVGRNNRSGKLDTYLTKATAKLLGGVSKPMIVVELDPAKISAVQMAWSEFLKNPNGPNARALWGRIKGSVSGLFTRDAQQALVLAAAIETTGPDRWETAKAAFNNKLASLKNNPYYKRLMGLFNKTETEMTQGFAAQPEYAETDPEQAMVLEGGKMPELQEAHFGQDPYKLTRV